MCDGWSLGFWLVPESGPLLLPSKLRNGDFTQSLVLEQELHVRSKAAWENGASFATDAQLGLQNHEPHCCVRAWPGGMPAGFMAVSLRPSTPGANCVGYEGALSMQCRECGVT